MASGKFALMLKSHLVLISLGALAFGLVGCGNGGATTTGTSGGPAATTGGGATSASTASITVDGSSTVLPISEAMAEEYKNSLPSGAKGPTVAASGTGGGFKKFAAGEIDIAGASRPIDPEEIAACKAKGIEFVEIPIAFDGLSVVVNKDNDFCQNLSVADLKRIWEGGSKVKTWRDVNPAWPAEPMKLYGAGTDSGTFDYFTEEINGKKGNSRSDYQPSEDDNMLVKGVAGDKYALGYFGYGYYEPNKESLKLVKIGGVEPSPATILDGSYTPLSRPLFWYINRKALDRPDVQAFVGYLLGEGKSLIASTGYVPLPDAAYVAGKTIIDEKKTGSRFQGAGSMKIEDVLARESK